MNTLGNHMIDIRLEALPAYAAFLLSRKLEEFVRDTAGRIVLREHSVIKVLREHDEG